ncbi:MAG: hypothetical protein WBX25_09270, partial [Rhodomicrobium sp.]
MLDKAMIAHVGFIDDEHRHPDGLRPARAVPELIESEGIHKEAEAVESALVQDGGSDGLFEGSAGSI